MKGVGGPLLCIGDLLSDLREDGDSFQSSGRITSDDSLSSSAALRASGHPASDLNLLFQEHYDGLNEALNGSNHSWTDLTLKLCAALETANKLMESTNSNACLLLEKFEELKKIMKREDSAFAEAKTIHASLISSGH